MTRVPLDTAAAVAEVDKATIRKWVHRGHIKRYADGYDLNELLHWVDHRNQQMAELASLPRNNGGSTHA